MALNDIDPLALYPLNEVRGLLPSNRGGRPVHLSTLHRWRLGGRLPCVRRSVGGAAFWYVRGSDLLRLYELPPEPQGRPRTRAEARAGYERAARSLRERLGVAGPQL